MISNEPSIVRTPQHRFNDLPDYPFRPHYAHLDGSRLRMHYVDERPEEPSGETIVLLHGNPAWSYLYRKVVPPLVAAGHRCVAVDLIGFGKSDKLVDRFAYTYQGHIDWLREALFDVLDLHEITLVCHDWGGGIGLPLLAEHPERFRRAVALNTSLSTGDEDLGPAWPMLATWLQTSQRTFPFEPSAIVNAFTATELTSAVSAAYDAPFPDESHLQAVRQFPLLIPISPADENTPMLRRAQAALERLELPFLCVFSDQDHVSQGDHSSLSGRIPGAAGRPHAVIANAGHFVQEDAPDEVVAAVEHFLRTTGSALTTDRRR